MGCRPHEKTNDLFSIKFQSTRLLEFAPVASLYAVASLSYSAACCEDCFLRVAMDQSRKLIIVVGVKVRLVHSPKSRSLAFAAANSALRSWICLDWSPPAMSFRDCEEV